MLKVKQRYFEFNVKEVSSMPIWITLPRLPLDLWNPNTLGKIVYKVGKPISMDKLISPKEISYLWVLVEIDVSEELVQLRWMHLKSENQFLQINILPKITTLYNL